MQGSLAKRAERFIKEQSLIEQGERVLVGLSGGADSVCLLAVLKELRETFSLTLGAFHVNHGIRGGEADRDEAFSEALCKRFEVPFFTAHEDVPRYAKEHGLGIEEAGREVRYLAAERIAKERGYDKIALAHQQKDVAETFLFHLFRGSSVTGLSSIPAKRGNIIRPLLFCNRNEIEDYLKEQGLSYCTDSTNGETEYTRNKIRHQILAVAEDEVNEGAVRHVAEAAAELSELNEYLSDRAEEVCKKAEEVPEGVQISIADLKVLHRAVRNRAVHSLLVRVAGSAKDMTREHVEAVCALCMRQSGKRVSLPYDMVAEREFDRLVIRRYGKEQRKEEEDRQEASEVLVEIPGEYSVGRKGETMSFRIFPYKKNAEIPRNEYTKWFDYDKIKGALRLRPRKEGDRLGMRSGSKSVKALFVEKKIAKEERAKRLLLADEAQVLLVPGVRSCDNYRVEETTTTVLEVQLYGGREHE
ncbi:MAG: tRNA lysidine(34) synthetase TilS [Lachnospiraceae bacterium]|nr:tRNA lysidine(34) synthetase TilS [Lachnospiraceae bacterium]